MWKWVQKFTFTTDMDFEVKFRLNEGFTYKGQSIYLLVNMGHEIYTNEWLAQRMDELLEDRILDLELREVDTTKLSNLMFVTEGGEDFVIQKQDLESWRVWLLDNAKNIATALFRVRYEVRGVVNVRDESDSYEDEVYNLFKKSFTLLSVQWGSYKIPQVAGAPLWYVTSLAEKVRGLSRTGSLITCEYAHSHSLLLEDLYDVDLQDVYTRLFIEVFYNKDECGKWMYTESCTSRPEFISKCVPWAKLHSSLSGNETGSLSTFWNDVTLWEDAYEMLRTDFDVVEAEDGRIHVFKKSKELSDSSTCSVRSRWYCKLLLGEAVYTETQDDAGCPADFHMLNLDTIVDITVTEEELAKIEEVKKFRGSSGALTVAHRMKKDDWTPRADVEILKDEYTGSILVETNFNVFFELAGRSGGRFSWMLPMSKDLRE